MKRVILNVSILCSFTCALSAPVDPFESEGGYDSAGQDDAPDYNSFAAHTLFNWFRDSLFYTLNPATSIQGPLLRPGNEHEYISSIFRIIVRQADARARRYRELGDNPAYYGFLIGALTVPHHESHLIHFRQLTPLGQRCVHALNSGQSLVNAGEPSLIEVFRRYLKSSDQPVVPECNHLYGHQNAVQLVSSNDYFSNGIMQVAINWHVDEYIIPRTYLSVPATLAYGIGVYFNGYNQAYYNARAYPCLKSRDQRMNYFNLVRGAWAGSYNSGNTASTCRFANPRDRWAANDQGFLQTLHLILNNQSSLYARHLNGLERSALDEIISNFKNGRHSRISLDRILQGSDSLQ